jgi:hypothetical protein
VALDGDGTNSPFALALASNLESPGLEINLLFLIVPMAKRAENSSATLEPTEGSAVIDLAYRRRFLL